jgi:succinate dehydrogenase/fumarate reductase cytochrome b subunit
MEIKSLDEYKGPPRTTGAAPNTGPLASCRSHSSGVWIWFAQRIAAVATLIFLLLHIQSPSARRIQFALLATVVVHVAAGVRVLVMEYGRVSTRFQASLFWILLGTGGALLAAFYCGLL